jgi:hypothetical protein
MKTSRKYYAFHYEFEHLWGDPKKRRVRVSKRPKEYQGPFDTKAEASQAVSRDARKYGAKVSDYSIAHLTPAQFSRKWHGGERTGLTDEGVAYMQAKQRMLHGRLVAGGDGRRVAVLSDEDVARMAERRKELRGVLAAGEHAGLTAKEIERDVARVERAVARAAGAGRRGK